jgi:protein CpxP
MDRKAMRDEFEKLSTPECLDRMQAISDMRRSRMAERAGAIKAFYVQLSAGQQRVFDAEAMPRHHRHDHPHQHRHQS